MNKKLNVILIGIDTLRADHLGCYGYARPTTPNIDKFASEALLFENCFSHSPVTSPSFMSIFTSRYPIYHGILANTGRMASGRTFIADENVPTMAELLKDNGYRTGAFTGGGPMAPRLGFDRGFEYYGVPNNRWTPPPKIPRDEIFYWFNEYKKDNFFLFLHTYAVHNPWFAPQKYWNRFDNGYAGKLRLESIFNEDGGIQKMKRKKKSPYLNYIAMADPASSAEMEYMKGNYDAAIQYVDDFFGDLIDHLGSLDLLDNTLIIFTADHGEEFGEHGRVGHKQLYNELLHVPLIIRVPGVSGGRFSSLVRSVDIFPTIFSVSGINFKHPIHGVPLFPVRGSNILPAISDTEHYGHAYFDGKYKYIYPRYRKFRHRVDELYDIESDPRERENILFQNPEILQEKINEFEHELHHRVPMPLAKKTVIYFAGQNPAKS